MTFPDTQASLIIRLSGGGSETDWQQFLSDYWGPITRFAARRGNLPLDSEWSLLRVHLEPFGGLEGAIRLEAASLDRLPRESRKSESFLAASAELRRATTASRNLSREREV